MTNNSLSEICLKLNLAKVIAIFCHVRPDGDTLGAAVALATALNNSGKKAVVCCGDAVPEKYGFLQKIKEVKDNLPADYKYDTFISVDCSDISRLGVFANTFSAFKGVKINIDHHVSNKRFAAYNYVYECSATCEIITRLLFAAGFEIDGEIANLLMLGLVTDSGTFTHSDVTDKTFEIAAQLKKRGADVNEINYQIFTRQTKFKAILFGKVIENMRFALDDKLAFVVVKRDYFENNTVDGSITEGFVDYPLSIDGVEISISLLEVKRRQFKISLRSKGKVNVNAVASLFGGGGHVLASGCMLNGELEEVIDKLTYAVYQNL